jgi:hypothetical protein
MRIVRLLRALTPTVAAFTATSTAAAGLGWSAHWWLGLLAGFPAVILVEMLLAWWGEVVVNPRDHGREAAGGCRRPALRW